MCRDNAKLTSEVEGLTGQVKQAQSVVPPMERLVQGLEKQQADTLKYACSLPHAGHTNVLLIPSSVLKLNM